MALGDISGLDAGVGALIAAMLGIFLFFMFLGYIFLSFALMGLSKKTNTDKIWLCWIPIAQMIQLPRIGGLPWWWGLIYIGPMFIPVIGPLISVGIGIYIWWKVAEAVNKPGWWSLLLLIPIVNIVLVCIMAWGKK